MWRKRNFLSKVIYTVRHTLLFPFLAIIYLFAPASPLAIGLTNPVVKFISHTGSFAVFLVLLIISAFQDNFHEAGNTPSTLGKNLLLHEHMITNQIQSRLNSF